MTKVLAVHRVNSCLSRLAMLLMMTVIGATCLSAQTFSVLHNFTNGRDGSYPVAGLAITSSGTLYGTTAGLIYSNGGPSFGSVFRLQEKNGSWLFTPLYVFSGAADGAYPVARVVVGANGTLYGTTNRGGNTNCFEGCGLVFNLRPRPSIPASPLVPWTKTVLYSFQGGSDGAYPGYGDIVFDPAGNIYNTASQGGSFACSGHLGCGAVYKLTLSGQTYTESVIYNFTGGSDGAFPIAAASFDHSGNLFTTAYNGGNNDNGTVIQLTPSGGGWNETTIHQFSPNSDGANPWTGVIVDSTNSLYGTTSTAAPNGGGSAYKMTSSDGSWSFSMLDSFSGSGQNPGPRADLAIDASGNLYGTTYAGGAHGFGSVFKLTLSGGSYTYSDLYDFTGGNDGANPASNVVFDASGNMYGTAYAGGADRYGVVWKITL